MRVFMGVYLTSKWPCQWWTWWYTMIKICILGRSKNWQTMTTPVCHWNGWSWPPQLQHSGESLGAKSLLFSIAGELPRFKCHRSRVFSNFPNLHFFPGRPFFRISKNEYSFPVVISMLSKKWTLPWWFSLDPHLDHPGTTPNRRSNRWNPQTIEGRRNRRVQSPTVETCKWIMTKQTMLLGSMIRSVDEWYDMKWYDMICLRYA